GQRFVPSARDMPAALDLQDLTNAVYETGYELGSRGPDWARIPVSRLERIAFGPGGS
ncbi:MAG: hypothetical protein JWM98_424, partial [Thermoleophilia bacterium]|nr:hypothetical protein [Thermoleophilia bacterium]